MKEKATSTCMGVCATIANKTGIDVFLIRIIAVVLLFASAGMFILAYLVLGMFASEVD